MVEKEADRLILVERLLYTYSISHLHPRDKVRFFYALKGRNSKEGIIDSLGIIQLGKTVLVSYPRDEGALSSFLSSWGCPFSLLPVLLAPDNHQSTANISFLGEREKIAEIRSKLNAKSIGFKRSRLQTGSAATVLRVHRSLKEVRQVL